MVMVTSCDEIADAIRTIVQTRGHEAVTARLVAASLHVAPATIYAACGSMDTAVHLAKQKAATECRDALDALDQGNWAPMLDWTLENRRLAAFVADPCDPTIGDLGVDADRLAYFGVLLAEFGAAFLRLEHLERFDELTAGDGATTHTEIGNVEQEGLDAARASAALLYIDNPRLANIVQASIGILDDEGIGALNYRRLSDRSGVAGTTMHRIVNRHGLMEAMLDALSHGYASVADPRHPGLLTRLMDATTSTNSLFDVALETFEHRRVASCPIRSILGTHGLGTSDDLAHLCTLATILNRWASRSNADRLATAADAMARLETPGHRATHRYAHSSTTPALARV